MEFFSEEPKFHEIVSNKFENFVYVSPKGMLCGNSNSHYQTNLSELTSIPYEIIRKPKWNLLLRIKSPRYYLKGCLSFEVTFFFQL